MANRAPGWPTSTFRAIDLFGQHAAHQHMRPSHPARRSQAGASHGRRRRAPRRPVPRPASRPFWRQRRGAVDGAFPFVHHHHGGSGGNLRQRQLQPRGAMPVGDGQGTFLPQPLSRSGGGETAIMLKQAALRTGLRPWPTAAGRTAAWPFRALAVMGSTRSGRRAARHPFQAIEAADFPGRNRCTTMSPASMSTQSPWGTPSPAENTGDPAASAWCADGRPWPPPGVRDQAGRPPDGGHGGTAAQNR